MKIILTIITVFTFSFLDAQVWNGNVTINNSNDITTYLSGYSEIIGDVTISPFFSTTSNILKVNGLKKLTGSLLIKDNQNITRIDLGSLELVGAFLVVSNNSNLTTIELGNLNTIKNSIEISKNPLLQSFNSKDLSFIKQGINISNNGALSQINLLGVQNLPSRQLNRDLVIKDNQSLQQIISPKNIKRIGGNLEIGNNPSLNDISPFISLSFIQKALLIYKNNLDNYLQFPILKNAGSTIFFSKNIGSAESLDLSRIKNDDPHLGLAGNYLYKIKADFIIEGNTNLKVLHAPDSLLEISQELYIRNNLILTKLNGFRALKRVGYHLVITKSAIKTLTNFESLEMIGRSVSIDENLNIKKIDFSKVKGEIGIIGNGSNGEGIFIQRNPMLTTLKLPDVDRINGYLKITGNSSLNVIKGLNRAFVIEEWLVIESNDLIEDLSWLNNLQDIESDNLGIARNRSLSSCSIHEICSILNNGLTTNSARINNNNGCCNTEESVLEDCNYTCCTKSAPIYVQSCNNLVLQSKAGDCFRVAIDKNGNLKTIPISCPK